MADGEKISQSPEFDLPALRRCTAQMHCPDVDRVSGVNHNMLKMLEKAEIVNKRGRLMAGVTYRATRGDALDCYEKALKLAPDEKPVYLEYANGLLLLNRNRNREQARELLSQGIEFPPEDGYGRILHDLTIQRLAALGDD